MAEGDTRSRRSVTKTRSRDAIVVAAVRVLEDTERAFDARTVAKEAGKSLGTLSFHFREGGLHELKGEVAGVGFRRLLHDLSGSLAGAADPIDGLRRLGHAYVKFAAENPRLHRLMFGEPWERAVEPARSSVRGLIRDHIVACQDAGVVRPDAPEKLARVGWACLHGIAGLYLDGQIPIAAIERTVDETVDALLEGLAA